MEKPEIHKYLLYISDLNMLKLYKRNILYFVFSSFKKKINLWWIKDKLLSRKIKAFSQQSNKWRTISHEDASIWAETEQNPVQNTQNTPYEWNHEKTENTKKAQNTKSEN